MLVICTQISSRHLEPKQSFALKKILEILKIIPPEYHSIISMSNYPQTLCSITPFMEEKNIFN